MKADSLVIENPLEYMDKAFFLLYYSFNFERASLLMSNYPLFRLITTYFALQNYFIEF